MQKRFIGQWLLRVGLGVVVLALQAQAQAQAQVIGPADAGRVEQRLRDEERIRLPAPPVPGMGDRKLDFQKAPKGSADVRFVLNFIMLKGVRPEDAAQIEAMYAVHIGTEISLETLWEIAGHLTEYYQKKGHFLSRVYVPEQEISDGKVRLKLVEGFISELGLDARAQRNPQVKKHLGPLVNQQPLPLAELEAVLAKLSALPGEQYRAVLAMPQARDAPEGAVRLNLFSNSRRVEAYSSVDNYGSRFLGPYQINHALSLSLFPNQRTDLTALVTPEIGELKYGSIRHTAALGDGWTWDGSAGIAKAQPADMLATQEILSLSRSVGLGVSYDWWQDRTGSLSTRLGLEARQVQSKTLGTALSKDKIRTARATLSYVRSNASEGSTVAEASITQGLPVFGASGAGDSNLTRAEAKPGFTKLEVSATHYTHLPAQWMLVGSAMAQGATGPLYASEEFGYGGQRFGRAYDNSEITGDHAVAGSLELRYLGVPITYDTQMTPYVFYDIGQLWNEDRSQAASIDASSAGAGMRLVHARGVNGHLGFAFPLMRSIAHPLNGEKSGPRLMLQMGVGF